MKVKDSIDNVLIALSFLVGIPVVISGMIYGERSLPYAAPAIIGLVVIGLLWFKVIRNRLP